MVMRMEGDALLWFQSLEADVRRSLTPSKLMEQLKLEFSDLDENHRARTELANLSQKSSVREYVAQFRQVCRRIGQIDASEKLHRFLYGLSPNIRREVYLRETKSFDEAARVALRLDSLESLLKSPVMSSSPSYPVASPLPVDRMELDALTRGRKTLSDAERRELRRTGGCFYCRQPGHMKRECPNRSLN